jgi:hypothetical protein
MPSIRHLPALVLVACISIAAYGQIDRAELNGTITDPSGASISNVHVTITQEGTNAVRNVVTDSHGQFVASSLPVGRFSILLQDPNFEDVRIADIDLHSGDVRTLNEQMKVGSLSQTVSIEADKGGAQLDKSDATFGGTIQSVQVQQLPLNGRNIATLELLAPGAIDNGTGQQASIRFAGQGIDDNNFRLDGVDASGIYRMSLKSGLRLQYSTEAVAEFKVDAGTYTADTGGSAGGQVSLISKSGTNTFHGSVFDYLRNSYFDAQSPIQAKVHPQFHLNQFGANIGGPLVQNRTFFFVNYEGFRQQLGGVPQIGFVPSPAFRAQVTTAQPALAPIVNAFPQGQAPSGSDPNAYTFTGLVPSPENENSGVVRVDHRFGEKDSGYARYNIDDGTATSALNALAQAITIVSRVQNLVLEENHIFDAHLLNEAQIGFNRNTYIQSQQTGELPDKGLRKEQVAGYAQDEWKATPNLTVNYGLRYNFFSPFHEVHDSANPFDIASCGGYCGTGAQFTFNNYLSFDPRVGLAYSPDSLDGKTVFRAGFGIYHGENQIGDEDSPVVNTEPSVTLTSGAQSNGSTVQFSYPVPASLTPSTGLALTPRSLARNHPDSYTEQWAGSIQQALPGDTVLTVTYLGVKGTHLFRRSYTNLIDPATGMRPLPQSNRHKVQ